MQSHLCFSVVICIFIFSGATRGDDILTSPIVTDWGDWGIFEHCPAGTKVIGFQLKTETWHAGSAVIDDTCLNGVRFYCGHPSSSGSQREPIETIMSSEGSWGKWGKVFWCDGLGFARGFMLRSEESDTALVDETAANNLRILCMGGTRYIDGDGERWGEWTTPRNCKENQYICGLQTQIESPQGTFKDDTSLNNIRIKCCDLAPEEFEVYKLQLNSTDIEFNLNLIADNDTNV